MQSLLLKRNVNLSITTIKKLEKAFYFDNCVTSIKLLHVKNFILEASEILASGGFDLRGWEYTRDNLDNQVSQVLGIYWNKKHDMLSLNHTTLTVEIPETRNFSSYKYNF